MQTKTFVALIGTILVLLIGVNESAPTIQVILTPAPTAVRITPRLAGGRGPWLPKVDPSSKKVFNDYKKIIAKKLQVAHKVPPKFVPKPDRVALQSVRGTIYHYLIKVPTKQYAYVTIIKPFGKDAKYGSEERVNVKPTLFALNDKNI